MTFSVGSSILCIDDASRDPTRAWDKCIKRGNTYIVRWTDGTFVRLIGVVRFDDDVPLYADRFVSAPDPWIFMDTRVREHEPIS